MSLDLISVSGGDEVILTLPVLVSDFNPVFIKTADYFSIGPLINESTNHSCSHLHCTESRESKNVFLVPV